MSYEQMHAGAPSPALGESPSESDADAPGGAVAIGRATQIVAALVSLVLLAGVGVWGTKLVLRDVSGVPVVRAAEGPMRIAPEEPGGQAAAHQGLAVNAVAASGTAAPPAEELLLAPTPVALAEEDLALGALEDQGTRDSAEDAHLAEAPGAVREPTRALLELATQIGAEERPELPFGVKFEPARATPVPAALRVEEPAAEDAAAQAVDAAVEAVVAAVVAGDAAKDAAGAPEAGETPKVVALPGVPARSLRPRIRPENLDLSTLSSASASAPARPEVAEADPETLPPGTRLVQLGAYESAEVARAEWGRIAGRFDAYLAGKTRVVERAESGGRVFYRLRAMGFEDLADARRFCAALMAANADCIPVVTR
jgi:hypothetical protein